jgi:hypothetical protein
VLLEFGKMVCEITILKMGIIGILPQMQLHKELLKMAITEIHILGRSKLMDLPSWD